APSPHGREVGDLAQVEALRHDEVLVEVVAHFEKMRDGADAVRGRPGPVASSEGAALLVADGTTDSVVLANFLFAAFSFAAACDELRLLPAFYFGRRDAFAFHQCRAFPALHLG